MQSCGGRTVMHWPGSSDPQRSISSFNNYLWLPATCSVWTQTRNCPDPGSRCHVRSWDNTGPWASPYPTSSIDTWGAGHSSADTRHVRPGGCRSPPGRCYRSRPCCPRNTCTREVHQHSLEDMMVEAVLELRVWALKYLDKYKQQNNFLYCQFRWFLDRPVLKSYSIARAENEIDKWRACRKLKMIDLEASRIIK